MAPLLRIHEPVLPLPVYFVSFTARKAQGNHWEAGVRRMEMEYWSNEVLICNCGSGFPAAILAPFTLCPMLFAHWILTTGYWLLLLIRAPSALRRVPYAFSLFRGAKLH